MFQRYRNLIPVLLLAACCIYTIVIAIGGTVTLNGTDYDFMLNAKHYSAFAAVVVTLASFFFLRRYFKYMVALIFLLGGFGLVNFTPMEMNTGLSVGERTIGMSPVLLLIGIVTYLLNTKKVNTALLALIKPSEEKTARVQQEEIAEFKSRFSQKSTEELASIVAANALVPAALTAARQLIRERQ